MITEFCFHTPDKPRELSKVTTVLGQAGVNIEGLSTATSGGSDAHFRLVVDDENKARKALESAGISFTTNNSFILSLANEPGTLGKLSSKLGDAGVNITSFYVTMGGKQVLGVDQVDVAKGIVS